MEKRNIYLTAEEEEYEEGMNLWKYFVLPILITVVALNVYSVFKDSGYEFANYGQVAWIAIGTLLVVLLPSLLIAKVMMKKKSSVIVICGLIYLGISFVNVLFVNPLNAEEELQASRTEERIIEMLGDYVKGRELIREEFSVEEYGEPIVLVNLIQDHYLELQRYRRELEGDVKKFEDVQIFSKEALMDYDKIVEGRQALKNYIGCYEEFLDRELALKLRTKEELDQIELDNEYIVKFKEEIDEKFYGVRKSTEEEKKNSKEAIQSMDNFFKFFEEHQGEYFVNDEKIEFKSEEDNATVERLLVEMYEKVNFSLFSIKSKENAVKKGIKRYE